MTDDQIELDLSQRRVGYQPPETSREAAKIVKKTVGKRRLAVLRFAMTQGKHGITGDEVAAHLGVPMHAGQPRVTELHQMGYLTRCDDKEGEPARKRPTRQGGNAFVYIINAAGRAALGL